MKIPTSIRSIYEDQNELKKLLKEQVDKKLSSAKPERWHYESRIKSLESFALKLETGRVGNPRDLEDYFGCMLVVENKIAIKSAERLILEVFPLKERRPRDEETTLKNSNAFPFDDLRLYVTWRDDPRQKPSGVNGLLFEVQIKTYFQHAWSIATHDLIYKTDNVSWAKERIAYQIKAMLEHAEISILEAEKLAESNELNKSNSHTNKILKVITFVKGAWAKEMLPSNLVLFAKNILELLISLDIDLDELSIILEKESKIGRGVKTLNLSPYGIIIQAIFNQRPEKMVTFMSKAKIKDFKILLPKEIEIPSTIDKGVFKNAIFA